MYVLELEELFDNSIMNKVKGAYWIDILKIFL